METNKREVLLKVEHLEQYFKIGKKTLKAVDDVTFEIYKGEVFGLVGESGCGKTTTGRSIIRLYDITGGSIYFAGRRIGAGIRTYQAAIANAKKEYKKALKGCLQEYTTTAQDSEAKKKYLKKKEILLKNYLEVVKANTKEIKNARFDQANCNREFAKFEVQKVIEQYDAFITEEKDEEKRKQLIITKKRNIKIAKKNRIMNKIQMIFQDPIASLDPRMTVYDIIAEGLIIRGVHNKKVMDEAVYQVLELVGLVPEHASRYPHEFSGGQRQRIGVARAIILNPELIIADEPISALDVSIQAQVINLLNELREKMKLTILFIAHDLSVVKYFSDRIAVMYQGKIVELASSDELFAHPLHPYTKSLLSAIPLPDPYFEKKRIRMTYNPIAAHDYSVEKPQMREIVPGHFVYCSETELIKYQREVAEK